ncbi:MAG: UMP kinase [Clostridia bacterium]|nr:UMP kinase [Clostridia bacterium]
MSELLYKRILLKLSGEALQGKDGILNFDTVNAVCEVIKKAVLDGVEVSLVIGAGNIWRGISSGKMDRTKADNMGMLATVINSIALQDTLISLGVDAKVLSAVKIEPFAEYYTKDLADAYLKAGKVVIFCCGTGHPFFSTDTGAVLRGAQLEVDALLFAKNIDGVYTADPKKDPTAKKLDDITYEDVLEQHLVVIDTAATAFAMENKLKICLFGLSDPENILRVVHGEKIGTLMHNRETQ